MHIKIRRIVLVFSSSILLLFGCSQKNNNIDLDLSNLPKPKSIKVNDQSEKNINNTDNQFFIRELIPFKEREKLLSKFKFGKKNPFSKGEAQLNQFSSNFKLTGFLNTDIKKYVFVNYLGKKGTISEDSIGGLNTDLLPNGAKVKTIDPNKKQLKISFDNEDYIFEL